MSRKRVTVSEARAHLYELVEYVTDTPDAEVVIEHRTRKGRAVLVDAARLRYLETTLREMQKREARPFQLFGSMEMLVPEDEFDAWLDEHRKEKARLSGAKLRDL